ncbi:MAG TPA: CYTH domain-containing protein, partial [Acinetobacter sp.]|nr:CYTH domain-containing protein [Acinetobacter sp.]
MSEIELKFQIPEAFQDMIYQDFCASKVYKQRLLAHYYDTEDFQLAQQSIALRLRLEQSHWIQTLKYKTARQIERFEFESDLGKKKQPKLNLGVYQDHLDELPTLLTTPDAAQKFQIKFSTDVKRISKILLFNQSEIEVCLDIGHLVFQNEKLRIFEIEFELVQGSIHDLIRCIEPWMNKYQLWLDTRSKSQRGDLHLQQQDMLLPQYAEPILLDQEMTTNSAVQIILNNTFKHFLPNATALASGSYNSEHVHQARVAIRRMRSALKSYAHL